MFVQLFQHPYALARQRNGPLVEERRRFLALCAEQQMARWTLRNIANYILVVAKVLRLAERTGEVIARNEIDAAANRWVNRKNRPQRKRNVHRSLLRFTGYATRWLTFLGRLQPPAVVQRPNAEHIAEFSDYMLRERGLSSQTVAYRCRTIHKFLGQIDDAHMRLDQLTAAQVDELLAQKVRDDGYARLTIRAWASALRPFFRFAEERGWCRPGLAAAIMVPRVYTHEGLPLGPSWDDVNRMLAALRRNRPDDIRDRAVLMLLAVYGLRAGEIATLQLEDFDWEREVLSVPHGKRQRPRTYPLCRSVGDAVLRYLREVRPRSNRREVFLILRAPFGPLSSGTVGQMVSRRLHALGVTSPHYGSHALRHACATRLLMQGLSLKEIADHLGHQSLETTRIYAKVDLAALRLVGDFDLEGLL
jgi:integrase/recombinase XerD